MIHRYELLQFNNVMYIPSDGMEAMRAVGRDRKQRYSVNSESMVPAVCQKFDNSETQWTY